MTDKALPPIYSKDGSHDIASLRDYFAAKAMQGFFSSGTKANMGTRYKEDMEYLATAFYSMADAMLKVRGE